MRNLLLVSLLAFSIPASATPIQLDFTGRVENPESPYYLQPVEATFTFDRVLSFDYQVDSIKSDCIAGVDATLGISSAYATLNGAHIDASPSTAVFRADGMCSGFYSFIQIYDGDDRIGGFQIDLGKTVLSEMLASEDPFFSIFSPRTSGSTFALYPMTDAGGYATAIQVPEPGTLGLLSLGLLGVALSHRKRAKILARV